MNAPKPSNRIKLMPAGERAHRRPRTVTLSPPRLAVPQRRPRPA